MVLGPLLLASGCAKPPQTIVLQPANPPQVSTRLGSGRAAAANRPAQPAPASAQPLQASEPEPECEARLHDLAGDLLLYYTVNHRFPNRLEDLTTVADDLDERSVTCPVSHQRYLYAPTGLSAAGQSRLLVLYDAVPAHGGVRWAVMIDPPGAANADPVTWVVPMNESLTQKFTGVGGAAPAPASRR